MMKSAAPEKPLRCLRFRSSISAAKRCRSADHHGFAKRHGCGAVCKNPLCLTANVIMTFAFFGEIRGIGWGTLVMALLNGTVIGLFSRLLDKTFDFQLAFPRFAARFTLQAKNPAKKTPLCPAGQL